MRSHPPAAGSSSGTPRIAGLVALTTAVAAGVAGLVSPAGIQTVAMVAAASTTHGGPIDKILMNAADALRQAKSHGGNRVAVAPTAPVVRTDA